MSSETSSFWAGVDPATSKDDPPEYSPTKANDLSFSFAQMDFGDEKGVGETSRISTVQLYLKCTRCKENMEAAEYHYGCRKCLNDVVCICQKCQKHTPKCRIHNKDLIKRTLKSWSALPAYMDDISLAPTKDDNPLVHALKSQNHELTRFHAHDPELINAHTYLGYTPLHFAAHLGLVSGASILLSNGALTNSRDEQNMNSLLIAITLKQHQIVDLLLQHGANIHSVCGVSETTALHAAAASGCPHLVSLLLEKGAIIDLPSGRGTALQLACFVNSLECASILLAKGSNPNAKAAVINTPILSAVRNHSSELVDLLHKYGANIDLPSISRNKEVTALHSAVSNDSNQLAKKLIEKGADVNWRGKKGPTCLMRAPARRNLKICDMLINNGADLNAENDIGMNPLLVAAMFGQEEILDLLLKRGANGSPPRACGGKWKSMEKFWKFDGCRSVGVDVSNDAKKRILKRLRDAKHGK